MKFKFHINMLAAGCLAILGATVTPCGSAAELDPISPLLNEQTYGILSVDAERLNFNTVFDNILAWMAKKSPDELLTREAIQEATNGIAGIRSLPEKWIQDFRQAGGREIYALTYAADGLQFVVIVPMGKAGNRETMEKLFEPILIHAQLGTLIKQMKGDCLVIGNRESVARILSGKPMPRPDLESALESQGQNAVKLVLAPTADQRRVLQEMLPLMPVGTNQVPAAAILRSISWCSLGIQLAPAASVKLILQAANAGVGTDLEALEKNLMQLELAIHREIETKPDWDRTFGPLSAVLDKLLSSFASFKEQSRLTIGLEQKALEDIFLNNLAPAMAQAKARAAAINAMNNAKQIILACLTFQNDNKTWPEQLKVLVDKPGYLSNPQVLRDPRNPQREVGFEYLLPGKDYAKYPASTHILVHQIFDVWPSNGLCIAFLDGHAEIMVDKNRFDALLADTKARNGGK